MKPSCVISFFGLKVYNVLKMFLISLFLKCALISQKSDNCSRKEPLVDFSALYLWINVKRKTRGALL